MKKAQSFFTVGFLAGVLVAVIIFAYLTKNNHENNTARNVTVIKLGHVLDHSHPVHQSLVFMAKRLDEISAGQMKLEVLGNGQLGNETQNLEQVRDGILAMTKVSTASLESFLPEMKVFTMPFLFENADHFWKVLDGPIGKELMQVGKRQGLLGICYYDSGARSFYTIGKPILSPEDLSGMKIRVMSSKTLLDTMQFLGATATPISWGELYTALQQSMVDGAENNLPSFYTSRHFEVCKNFSFDEHCRIPDIILMSTKAWDALTTQQQQWLKKAAAESSLFQRKLWIEKSAEAMENSKAKGVKFYHPDKAPFAKKVKPMYDNCTNQKIKNLIQRIKEEK